jgi:DNA modification methylase
MLLLGDCLERMGEIPDGSVDLIAADLPFGVTRCRWDSVIPLEPLWAHYRRVLKTDGAVALNAVQPFTSMLVMSNRRWFRYPLVWDKTTTTGYLDSKRRPLRVHEDLVVFAPKRTTYHPQKWKGPANHGGRPKADMVCAIHGAHAVVSPDKSGDKYPRSILRFPAVSSTARVHPTQKPVILFEYLLKTYSNPGDLVLDNAMGSGTTLIAAINTGRRAIGIERDPAIFAVAERRIADHLAATPLLTG